MKNKRLAFRLRSVDSGQMADFRFQAAGAPGQDFGGQDQAGARLWWLPGFPGRGGHHRARLDDIEALAAFKRRTAACRIRPPLRTGPAGSPFHGQDRMPHQTFRGRRT